MRCAGRGLRGIVARGLPLVSGDVRRIRHGGEFRIAAAKSGMSPGILRTMTREARFASCAESRAFAEARLHGQVPKLGGTKHPRISKYESNDEICSQ